MVSGGGSGIGAALAQEAARRGARFVAVLDLDAPAADRTAAGLRAGGTPASGWACDVTDHDRLDAVADAILQAHGTPGLVCANAGVVAGFSPALDEDPAALAWVLSVNVQAVARTLQVFGRAMTESPDPGWLLVTGSEHGLCVPHIGLASYTASKHAVLGYAEVIRRELPDHVGISVICPSVVATGLWAAGRRRPDRFGGPARIDEVARPVMARGANPDDVASRALDGIAAEDFLILTDRASVAAVHGRCADLSGAVARLERTPADHRAGG